MSNKRLRNIIHRTALEGKTFQKDFFTKRRLRSAEGRQKYDRDTIEQILLELKKIDGIGQKVATMFVKFMISTFGVWKWKGNKSSLVGIAAPNDFQVRKVYLRLGNRIDGNIIDSLEIFSERLGLSFIEIDDVLWDVGRIFCDDLNPACHYCILSSSCDYARFRQTENRRGIKLLDEIFQNMNYLGRMEQK